MKDPGETVHSEVGVMLMVYQDAGRQVGSGDDVASGKVVEENATRAVENRHRHLHRLSRRPCLCRQSPRVLYVHEVRHTGEVSEKSAGG